MRPRVPDHGRRLGGDDGTSLIELLIALGLTSAAFVAIVGLISSSSRVAGELAADDPLAAVAVDWLANDLREATDIDVISTASADQATRLQIVTPDGVVEWGTSAGTVERTAAGGSIPQPVVDNLRTTNALLVSLRTGSQSAVDLSDDSQIDSCTRFVHVQIVDTDDEILHERTVSVRYPRWEASLC